MMKRRFVAICLAVTLAAVAQFSLLPHGDAATVYTFTPGRIVGVRNTTAMAIGAYNPTSQPITVTVELKSAFVFSTTGPTSLTVAPGAFQAVTFACPAGPADCRATPILTSPSKAIVPAGQYFWDYSNTAVASPAGDWVRRAG
jgi:hypothetical protein